MALFASDITGPTEPTEMLDLDAGTMLPRIVPITALVIAIVAIAFVMIEPRSEPSSEMPRYSLQRHALTLPAVSRLQWQTAPGVDPDTGIGPTMSIPDARDLAFMQVIAPTQSRT